MKLRSLTIMLLLAMFSTSAILAQNCSISGTISSVGVCYSNGTSNDPTDDIFSVNMYALNTDNTGQFTVTVNGTVSGPFDYGTFSHPVANIPANSTDIALVFTDTQDPSCTTTEYVNHAPCSSCENNEPTPTITAVNGTEICEGTLLSLQESSQTGYYYSWSGPNNFASQSNAFSIPNMSEMAAGTYTVTLTNVFGCSASTSVDITVAPSVSSVTMSDYGDICNTAGYLELTGSPIGGTFGGSGVDGDYYFVPTEATLGSNYVFYKYHDQCTNKDLYAHTIINVIQEKSAPNVSDISVCEGESTEIAPNGNTVYYNVIWSELFPENGVGVTGPNPSFEAPDNGQWELWGNFSKLTTNKRYFKVENNQLTARNTKKPLWFKTAPIDITDKEDVSFQVKISEDGHLENNDFVDIYYSIDGGADIRIPNFLNYGSNNHTLSGKHSPNNWGSKTITKNGLAGSSLVIKFRVKNTANNEYIHFDNLRVSAKAQQPTYYFYDDNPYSLSGAILLAGPVEAYDPQTTPETGPQVIWVSREEHCAISKPIIITVGQSASAIIDANTIGCEGKNFQLQETGNAATSWSWTGPNGFQSTEQNPSISNFAQANAGNYQVTVTNSELCPSATANIEVVSAEMLLPPSQSDITVCEGEDITLHPTANAEMALYSEYFNEDNVGVTGPNQDYTPPTNGQWSLHGNFNKLTTANRYFKVSNGKLIARNTKKKLTFKSAPIDISGMSKTDFSVDIFKVGPMEASDIVDVIYIVDGNPTKITNWQGQGNNNHTLRGNKPWVYTNLGVQGIVGNELIIKIKAKNSANNEYFKFDNLLVTGEYQPQFKFYDADPATNANLLAGPVDSFAPNVSSSNSPQTIWITTAGDCESEAIPIQVTVHPSPVIDISASSTTPCANQSVSLSATAQIYTSWIWSGPNDFTTSEQNPSLENFTANDNGEYSVIATSASGCTSQATITITASSQQIETPCFGLTVPADGYMIDFSPLSFNFYDNGGNLISEGTSTFNFLGTEEEYTVNLVDANGCVGPEVTVMINDPELPPVNASQTLFTPVMTHWNYPSANVPSPFTRLAWVVNGDANDIDIYTNFADALNQENPIPLPHSASGPEYVYFHKENYPADCPMIGVVGIIPYVPYASSQNVMLDKSIMEKSDSDLGATQTLVLEQNLPNPFREKTEIGFILPQDDQVTLSIFNINGQRIYETTGNFPKGHNQITISKSMLSNHGILYYQILTEKHSSVKKMLFVE